MKSLFDSIEKEIDGLIKIQNALEKSNQKEASVLIQSAISKLINLIPKSVRDVFCPQCHNPFKLTFGDYDYSSRSDTIIIRSCPSGGIYNATIKCPHCNYEEEV